MSTFILENPTQVTATLPEHIEHILQNEVSNKGLSTLKGWIFEETSNPGFWKTVSQKDINRMLECSQKKPVHKYGLLAIYALALLPAVWAGSAIWGIEDHLAEKLFWGFTGFITVFVGLAMSLLLPLSGLWNKLFGCADAHRIQRVLYPAIDLEIKMAYEELGECSWSLRYLDEVKSRRRLTIQDFRVAKEIARSAD